MSGVHSAAQPHHLALPTLNPALLLGVIDASVAWSYAFGVDSAYWHGGSLALKLGLVIFGWAQGIKTLRSNLVALSVMALISLVSLALTEPDWIVVAQTVGFFGHLALSLAILSPRSVGKYAKGVAACIGAATALYLVMVYTGHIANVYGRYLYFGENHPNLGSEIVAAAVIAAALVLRPVLFLAYVSVSTAAVLLMQGRSALLVCAVVGLIRVLMLLNVRGWRFLLICLSWVVAVWLIVNAQLVWNVIDVLFLLSDKYRGLETGLVGRLDRWLLAWSYFLEAPLVGKGMAFYESSAHTSPHNFFLYGLASFGLMAIPFFLVIARKAIDVTRLGVHTATLLGSALILATFNDRLMNLNPYPFVIFVLLFALSTFARHQPRLPHMVEERNPAFATP